jgi:selenocysteine lyase/cysteine desulfurase
VLDRGPVECMADEAGMGLALNWVQHALVTAYENNCPVRPVKPSSTSLRWTARLESLRRNIRRLFNKSRREQIALNRELHREA